MTSAELQVWGLRAQASIRALWHIRHEDPQARARVHHCCRVLRLVQGHHYRQHVAVMTCGEIGAAIECLLDRQDRPLNAGKLIKEMISSRGV